jgi:hypothetical protein
MNKTLQLKSPSLKQLESPCAKCVFSRWREKEMLGFFMKTPTFSLDIRLKDAVRLSALCTGCPLPPRKMPRTHFCYRLSRPQGHDVAERIR